MGDHSSLYSTPKPSKNDSGISKWLLLYIKYNKRAQRKLYNIIHTYVCMNEKNT